MNHFGVFSLKVKLEVTRPIASLAELNGGSDRGDKEVIQSGGEATQNCGPGGSASGIILEAA